LHFFINHAAFKRFQHFHSFRFFAFTATHYKSASWTGETRVFANFVHSAIACSHQGLEYDGKGRIFTPA
jgi:hypothetical protein